MPEAEPAVGDLRRRADPSAQDGIPAHITVLFPFLDGPAAGRARDALRDLCRSIEPFAFTLTATGRFPSVLYLAPEPVAPFQALTAAITARWPSHPPYRGEFADVIPHLTVAHGDEPPGAAASLEAALPIAARATALSLFAEQRGGRWALSARFPFGS